MAFKKEALKVWRIKNKLSQTDAARLFNMTQAFYSHLEVGRKAPSLDTLEIISNRTKIPISDLLDSAPNPTRPSPQATPEARAPRKRREKRASVA
jgi:transcriptional regulator with XRE-family HTH domain